MATRICFISTPLDKVLFREEEIEFKYHTGFAISQKQKSIKAMHEQINVMHPKLKLLEISTKSMDPLGVSLSAFNLKLQDYETDEKHPLENVFQSSKVFQDGGPYKDLLHVSPKDAKRDDRLKNSGELLHFEYRGRIWELSPTSMFYDWIYIVSLLQDKYLSKEILNYDAFTDIEFNHKKSMSCQARAAAIFVSLSRHGNMVGVINDLEKFKVIYGDGPNSHSQLTMF